MPQIISLKNMDGADRIELVGGKGMNLFRLVKAGYNVPPFIVLTTELFRVFIDSLGNRFKEAVARIDTSTPATIAKTAGELRALFIPAFLPGELRSLIIREVRENVTENGFIAVRSSATTEDSAEFSYAGQLDSFLFQKSDEQILESVTGCWASGFSDRAVAYRAMKGLPQGEINVAVVIQEMIAGEVSGVCFTVNPVTERIDELLISATYGLGEGIVSGQLNTDQYVFYKDKEPVRARTEIVSKKEKVVHDTERGYGTRKVEVWADLADRPCLTDERALQIARICRQIELDSGGVPQDIEWTVGVDGKIYILQTRPITTITALRPSEREYCTIWDNSNIVESYSGVTSPLTFSFALDAYHMVYVQFCEVLKVPRYKIIQNDFAFANMLGLLHGRVYYNLKNWYRLISVLPGYQYNSRFMEGMMGVKQKLDLKPPGISDARGFRKYFIELPQLIWSGINLAWQFLTIKSRVRNFTKVYMKMYNKYRDRDFNSMKAHELIDAYFDLENNVLRHWKAPIINDFMAMIFYGILKMLIEKWKLDDRGSLQNELLAGQGNVESTLPLRRLQEIARFIKSRPELEMVLKNESEKELVRRFIRSNGTGATQDECSLREMLASYLEEYGDRSMQELKLEMPSLRESPEFIFSILKNYCSGPVPEPGEIEAREREVRLAAERHVSKKLGNTGFINWLKEKFIFWPVVYYAKKAVAFREYQRFARTRMFGLARRLFKGLGHRLAELNAIDKPDDIFYLTKQEIFSYVVGTSTLTDLRSLVRARRLEFEKYAAEDELPDRIITYGPVYANDLTKAAPAPQSDLPPGYYRGISCCPGIRRGKVKVILHPSDDMSLSGEILVAARTDPGWVPLYPSASGLLIERGSILSHSAIVARELALPAIVGIPNITKVLRTGDYVEMDGASGLVRHITDPKEIEEIEKSRAK